MPDKNRGRRQLLTVQLGDLVENTIEKRVMRGDHEVPFLTGEPEEGEWYRVAVPDGMSGDGSPYHIYVRKGTSDRLCIFFSGGGIAWNEYTAARPVTGGAVAAWLPNYYWNNLRPFTQVMNVGVGITDMNVPDNPFAGWNFLIITYATGDMHLGRNKFHYTDLNGENQILYFHGYGNFMGAMRIGKKMFPTPGKLLIAGESAGSFAVPALAEQIVGEFYPACPDVTLFSDSGQLLYKEWRRTMRDVWKVPPCLWKEIHTTNVTLDWYRALCERRGSRFRCLYASSTRDYLLSAFYNDMTNQVYDTNSDVQDHFEKQLRHMVRELKKLSPDFGIFINARKRPVMTKGGTIHTMVRQPEFWIPGRDGVTQAKWLSDAVNGKVYDVGLDLLYGRHAEDM